MTLVELVAAALAEDIGGGDVTTLACVAADANAAARIHARQELVVSGQGVAEEVFRALGATYTPLLGDGAIAVMGADLGRVEGPARALLTGERVALNFLMRLCGIATHTRSVVARSGGLRVLDTRKTTPLHRELEKAAVRHGGGHNHRFGLHDGVLIKDNHLVAAGGVAAAISRARGAVHHLMKIEVEVESLAQLEEAIGAGTDAVLLDNMDDASLRAAVLLNGGRVWLEASGNMNADRISALAGIGLDAVSMGGLVHQARWVDLSMTVLPAS